MRSARASCARRSSTSGSAGGLLALHEEDPSLSGDGVMHEGEVSALLGVAGIPSVSESTMVARDAQLAAYEEGRIHVQHVSARETVEVIERAKAAGTRITAEATPHHLLLTDEDVRELDTHYKMNPPLRSEADRAGDRRGAALRRARLRGHRPRAALARGEGGAVRAGADGRHRASRRPSPRSTPSSCVPGVIGLGLLVERMTAGGEPFGIGVPTLAKGAPANVCLVDLAAEWEVGEAGYESRSANCAFAGRALAGRVRMTVAAGVVAYRERSFAIASVA